MTFCIFHEDKTAFESFRRQLQRHKLLPRNLSSRLAMAICSCRKKRTTTLLISNEEYSRMKVDIETYFNKTIEKSQLPQSSLMLLDRILRSDSIPNNSEKNLVYIIHKALDGNFDILKEEKRANTKLSTKVKEEEKGEDEGEEKEDTNAGEETKDKQHKLTMKQIGFMVRKRKRKMPIFSRIDLPIHGNNLYLLTRKTGRELKDVAQRFRCYIEIDWARIRDNIDAGVPVSTLKVWCRTPEIMDSLRRYFQELLESRELAAHVIMSNEYEYKKDISQTWERTLSVNYCLTDHFTEKVLGRKKPRNRYVISRQRVKSLPTALGSALCERCLQSYKDVLVMDRPCFFHPGNIVDSDNGKTWSCCNVSAEECPLAEEHHCTGCWEGSHIWNLSSVITTPCGDCKYMSSKSKHKLKWAVVGYAKAF